MCHSAGVGTELHGADRRDIVVPLPDGTEMPALLASPSSGESPESVPAILVVGDIFGGRSPFYESLATRVACQGFHVLAPEYFFREAPLGDGDVGAAKRRHALLDECRALDDLDAALRWLRSRPNVTGDRVGTIGFCLGGTLVLGLAARGDNLATVCFYGFPRGSSPGLAPRPPAPLEAADRINGPLLGLWGARDKKVPLEDVDAFAAALNDGVVLERVVYSDAGHGFLRGLDPDAAPELRDAAHDAWARTIGFLRAHVVT
jgi:carboxymethylenebutenolidase